MQGPDEGQIYIANWPSIEINSVEMHWLPFPDVRTSSHIVWCCIDSKNQAIILMLQFRHDMIKENICVLHSEHFLHVEVDLGYERLGVISEAFAEASFGEAISYVCICVDETIGEGERS